MKACAAAESARRRDSSPLTVGLPSHPRAQALSNSIERSSRVQISFFERRARQAAFGLFRSEERVTWERWSIPLSVLPPEASPNFEALHREMGGASPRGGGMGSSGLFDGRTSAHNEESRRRQLALEAALRHRLELVISAASGRREHIPPADGLGGESAWFDISSDSNDSWSGFDMLKQLLSSPPQLGSG